MKYIATSKNKVYEVRQNEDGTLFITRDGIHSIDNAGQFIMNFGGIEGILKRCVESDLQVKEFAKHHMDEIKAMKEARRAVYEKNIVKTKGQREAERKAEYEALLAENDGVIPTTYENIGVVLRYLNTQNWGGWSLPKMTIGYSCNQYDCDGRIATTMKLDRPINITPDWDTKEMESMFVYGAPHGHLTKYHMVR